MPAGARGGSPRRGAGLSAVGDRVRHRRRAMRSACRPPRARAPASRPPRGLTMFLTKRHLSRRTVLKGAGVTLALPLLDAMIPAATALAQTAAAPKLRMGFFYIPHGAIMGNTSHGPEMDKWTPSGSGADFKLSPILASLEPHKSYVTSFGNLQNQAMVGGVHSLAPATWLSGMRPGQRVGRGEHVRRRSTRWWRSTSARTRRSRRSSGVGNHAAGGRVQRLGVLLQHDALVPRRAFAAADGVQPAQGLRAAVRRGRHAGGARRDSRPDEEPAGSHHGPHGRAAARSGRERSGGARQLPRDGARDRAAGEQLASSRDLSMASTCPRRRSAS